MRHFDLKKALAGAPLVTRGGLKVTKFSTANNPKFFNVTLENGEQGIASKSENDLLLVAPDERWMQMFCAFVGQEWSDEMEFDEICQVVDKAYEAVDKHFAGKSELG
jgi:hypothetical protein